MDWLEEIKARANAATLGPWAWSNGYENILYTCANDKRPLAYAWSNRYGGSGIDINNDDAVFIAASRIDIPRLIHEVEHLRLKLVERQGIAMKDNHPNYLNYHGIDPSRIDQAPGFDSIRPGQKTEHYGKSELSICGCGSPAICEKRKILYSGKDTPVYTVRCDKNFCVITEEHFTKQAAIDAWNRAMREPKRGRRDEKS